jgi:hypothetical protein
MFQRATGMAICHTDDSITQSHNNDSSLILVKPQSALIAIHVAKHTGKDIDSRIND